MILSHARGVIAALSVASVLLSAPSESHAFFNWFGCGPCGNTSFYRPSSGCGTTCARPTTCASPCAPPCRQQCHYVPDASAAVPTTS